jgi:hypothetical protein
MTDTELRALLRSLGIDGRTWKVAAVLPLVHVAWADGDVHADERARILGIAKERGLLCGDGRMVLEGWLRFRPSPGYFARGLQVVQELARRGGLGECGMPGRDLLNCSEAVAKAAGGFLGMFGAVGEEEQATLESVAKLFECGEKESWHAFADDPTDEVPRPDLAPPSQASGTPPPCLRFPAGPRPAAALANPTVIGRREDCTIPVPDDTQLSRQHCNLRRHDGRWYVVDLASANGTFVDGERVLERRLFGGEELRCGGLVMTVDLD